MEHTRHWLKLFRVKEKDLFCWELGYLCMLSQCRSLAADEAAESLQISSQINSTKIFVTAVKLAARTHLTCNRIELSDKLSVSINMQLMSHYQASGMLQLKSHQSKVITASLGEVRMGKEWTALELHILLQLRKAKKIKHCFVRTEKCHGHYSEQQNWRS